MVNNGVLCFDCETSVSNKGDPFDESNTLVVLGASLDGDYREFYHDDCCGHVVSYLFANARTIVGFNLAFDIAWLYRAYGIEITDKQLMDCQTGYFIYNCQQERYPSLNGSAEALGLGQKLDVVKTEYWDKGLDTPDIPRDVLSDYLKQDVLLTLELYERLLEILDEKKLKLWRLQGWDQLCLIEMRRNGLQYDFRGSLLEARERRKELRKLDQRLAEQVPDHPINWSSPAQVAKVLYGGTVEFEYKETYLFQYKDPRKQPVQKTRKAVRTVELPRLVQPLKRKGEESYSVDEGTLKTLKATGKARKIISVMQERSKLSKLIGTYLRGYYKLNKSANWGTGMIFGTLTQTVAVTGRLASNRPNLQNADPKTKQFFVSRFD